jgi:hypothetical protein
MVSSFFRWSNLAGGADERRSDAAAPRCYSRPEQPPVWLKNTLKWPTGVTVSRDVDVDAWKSSSDRLPRRDGRCPLARPPPRTRHRRAVVAIDEQLNRVRIERKEIERRMATSVANSLIIWGSSRPNILSP